MGGSSSPFLEWETMTNKLTAQIAEDEGIDVLAANLAANPIGRERQSFYMFDVDHTLWLSDGPIHLNELIALRQAGHGVGLCGNWGHITFNQLLDNQLVQTLFSFIGPMLMTKRQFLEQVKAWTHYADYIMVGNDNRITPGVSEDAIAAEEAGWDFILEKDFAGGAR